MEMDSNLRCDEAVLASPVQVQNLSFNRDMNSSEQKIDNLNIQQQNMSYEDSEQTPNFVDFFIPHFIKAYQDRAILDDSRVFSIMLALEEWYIPDTDLNYCSSQQNEIKLHMRKIVADWMLDVCVDQRCQVNVFLLATNIMDRFLGTIALRKNQFQLLGAAAIFLASKMIEPTPISATTLVRCTADTYDREELLTMELLILSKLKWDVTAITAYDYLDHLLNALKKSMYNTEESETIAYDNKTVKNEPTSSLIQLLNSSSLRINAEKIILLCATDYRFANLPPSVVASAALMSAIQQEICQSQKKQSMRRSVILQTQETVNYSQPSSSSQSLNISGNLKSVNSAFKNINLNQIVARLQILTRVQMNNLKLTINLIEQLFVIPLSNDNIQKTIPSEMSNCIDKTSSITSPSPSDNQQCLSNQSQHVAQSCYNQKQEIMGKSNVNLRRSPETPISSPITNSSTLSSSSQIEDVFLPSSPPQASSSPISFRNDLSKQNTKSQRYQKPETVREDIEKVASANDYTALRSPKSSNIQGSVTIRALNEVKKSENIQVENIATKIEPSDTRYVSNDNSDNFCDVSWNRDDSEDNDSDSEQQERQYKKGDTPTEVFKVAALYVT